ncbi:MAG: hypothetical protein RJB65_532 [Actinomycetota bacterium]|jgi:hypothetical protein
MRRSLALTGIALLAGSSLLVSCGSDDAAVSVGTAAMTTDEAATTTADAAMNTAEYCDLIKSYEAEGDVFDTLFTGADTDAAALKAGFEKMGSMIDELSAKAPTEIEADVEIVAKATNALIDLLASYDYDFMAMLADPEASTELETLMAGADVGEASARLDEWGLTNCGIEPGS